MAAGWILSLNFLGFFRIQEWRERTEEVRGKYGEGCRALSNLVDFGRMELGLRRGEENFWNRLWVL